uniref:Uncharacterized protein n=1 Tax=Opuntia streptacantha TaxID=393608 RepID=A0A7C8YEK5_OPUST
MTPFRTLSTTHIQSIGRYKQEADTKYGRCQMSYTSAILPNKGTTSVLHTNNNTLKHRNGKYYNIHIDFSKLCTEHQEGKRISSSQNNESNCPQSNPSSHNDTPTKKRQTSQNSYHVNILQLAPTIFQCNNIRTFGSTLAVHFIRQ